MDQTMTENNAVSVFILDDHQFVTQGLRMRMNHENDIEVCGTAATVQDTLASLQNSEPEIMIVDLSLTDGNGMDVLKIVHEQYPGIKTIVLSSHDEKIYALRCIRYGAKGYVMKVNDFDTIIEAVRTVKKGGLFFSGDVKQQIQEAEDKAGTSLTAAINQLSEREFEIFKQLGRGLRQRQIAEVLFISPATVNSHCKNIRSKLYLSSMDELISKALDWFRQD
jgi:DNA-binding NarL/FixJ family response regulator